MTATVTRSQLRQLVMAVIDQIVLDHTDYPLVVEPDNRDVVDQATQTRPYLQVSIVPISGEQAELGQNPLVEYTGQILLAAVVKDGRGVGEAETLLDFVLPYFSLQTLGPVQCHAAWISGGKPRSGLWFETAIVPYRYFSTVA